MYENEMRACITRILSNIMTNKSNMEKTEDRLRAIELLCMMYGFIEPTDDV